MRCRADACLGLLLVAGVAGACTSPRRPAEAMALAPESLAQRQLETRRFDSTDEIHLLRAGLMILQDRGFQLDEMEADLGVIAATRPSAQSHAVSLVSRPLSDREGAIAVRVTFHDAGGGVRVADVHVYQEFFAQLSRAVSAEGREP